LLGGRGEANKRPAGRHLELEARRTQLVGAAGPVERDLFICSSCSRTIQVNGSSG
jgi:hypothetical protein